MGWVLRREHDVHCARLLGSPPPLLVVVMVAKRRGEIPTGHHAAATLLSSCLPLYHFFLNYNCPCAAARWTKARVTAYGQAHGCVQDLFCAKGAARASRRGVVEEGGLLRPQSGLPVGVKARTKHSPVKSVTARYS
jgi:hypothetical protein